MSYELQASAHATQLGNSLPILTLLIEIVGVACFAYIVYKRVLPMLHAERDFRLDRPGLRVQRVVKYWSASGSISATGSRAPYIS